MAAGPGIGRAQDEHEDDTETSAGRRAAATGVALVPGLLVHGSGLYLSGDDEGASRLLITEGIGLGLVAAGGIPLVLTGASRKLAWPTVPLVVSGLGLFTISWLADIYGASGLASWSGAPPQPAPMEIALGYAYVRDVHFDYDHFSVLSAAWRFDRLAFEPSAWLAVGADNQRLRVGTSYRLRGATPHQPSADGSYVDAKVAATWHRYGDDGFDTRLAEIELAGRLDLTRLSPSLRGGFFELSTGLGLEWLHYDIGGVDPHDENEAFGLLLGSFAMGMRLGQPGSVFGEVKLAYDHRRDDYAAGFSTWMSGSGFGGHFGAVGELFFGQSASSWGVRAETFFGAAHVFHVGVARRLGGGW